MSTGPYEGPAVGVPAATTSADGSPAPSRGVLSWGWGRTVAFIAVTAVAGASLLGGVGAALLLPLLREDRSGFNADGTIDDVITVDDLTNQHTDGPVDYEQMPPLGGDHLPVWQDCGFYDGAIVPEAGVHSLEHGAVWVTYDPDLAPEQVAELERLAARNAYLLVSPMGDLPTPVVASAWGVQLQLDEVDDARLTAFLLTYLQGPQNPEPGAPCSGGLSETASERSGTSSTST